MAMFFVNGRGVASKLDGRFFGGVKRNLDEMERKVAGAFLSKVASNIIQDMTQKILWQQKPDGTRQKQNSLFTRIDKQHRNVRPNIPLHNTGRLINKNNYRISIDRGIVQILPPSDRVHVIDDLRRRGYGFFEMPYNIGQIVNRSADEMTPADWFAMLDIFSVR